MKGNSMLISVVIPLYNKAAYIGDALRSVLAQTHGDLEAIVVDDGSEDAGIDRVQAFEDPRIRLVRQENAGVSCARNRGIAEARGEIVSFLDADDCHHPLFLATIAAMARSCPDISVFATSYRRVSGAAGDIPAWQCADTGEVEVIDDFFSAWLRYPTFFFTGTVAMRRMALLSLQPCFPPGESNAEDLDLWFRIAERFSIAYCPVPLAAYRTCVASGLSSTGAGQGLAPAIRRLQARALADGMPSRLRPSALRFVRESRVSLARRLMLQGQRAEAFAELIRIPGGMASRRWWVSMLMCLLGTRPLIARWEILRARRTQAQE